MPYSVKPTGNWTLKPKSRTLSAGFKNQMFKPSDRKPANMGRMTPAQMRAEYTRQAKVANKRINAINKSGLYSPAVAHLGDRGITRFGLKNQGLTTDKEIQSAYRELMDFLQSTTSSRTGIKTTADKMIQNFNMTFNGDYVEFSQKSKKIFDLYEDLRELSNQGFVSESDKYNIIEDLNTLYDQGVIDENTTADSLVKTLNQMMDARKAEINERQNQLRFNWRV